MSVRRLLAGVATTSLVAASLALMAPAQADPTFVPDADDIVGVGSDTSMYALSYLADGKDGIPGYNAGGAAARLASFDAKIFGPDGTTQTNSATIVLRAGTDAITRPNGSTEGKNLLHGAGNNPNVSYARSSDPLKDSEKTAGLFAFPFARDVLVTATSKTSKAPASLTISQLVEIYEGRVTNWTQVGGADAPVVAMLPQSGSGTEKFFLAQLAAAKGGPITLGPVTRVQEHDDSQLKGNDNAVAPFSQGRASLLGTLRIEQGWSKERGLYNVVRQADVGKPQIAAIFGKDGFVCSTQAKLLIEAAGFDQLATPAAGGVCGVPTQDPTTNFATNQRVFTATTVSGTSPAAGTARLVATVAGKPVPDGTVDFYVDGVKKATGVLTAGKATKDVTGLSAGNHSVVAKYLPPTGSQFDASESPATAVNVLAATPAPPASPIATLAVTKIKEAFNKSYNFGTVVKGIVKIKESAAGAATGTVKIKRGSKVVAKAKVKNGKAILKLKGLKKGVHKLVAKYSGDKNFAKSKLKFKITIK